MFRLETIFVKVVLKKFDIDTSRVDVIFSRYIGNTSIKTTSRMKRTGKLKPVRRLITGLDISLTQA